jgi:hypothetical protein
MLSRGCPGPMQCVTARSRCSRMLPGVRGCPSVSRFCSPPRMGAKGVDSDPWRDCRLEIPSSKSQESAGILPCRGFGGAPQLPISSPKSGGSKGGLKANPETPLADRSQRPVHSSVTIGWGGGPGGDHAGSSSYREGGVGLPPLVHEIQRHDDDHRQRRGETPLAAEQRSSGRGYGLLM